MESFSVGMQSFGMTILGLLKSEDVRHALVVVVLAFAASSFVTSILRLVKLYFYDPIRISRIMAKQGVRGPPFIPIVGSAHEIGAFEKSFPESMPLEEHYGLLPTVKTQFHLFFPRFGQRFIYYRGPQVKLVSRDPQFAKEVLSLKYGFFERHPDDVAMLQNIVGLGLDNLTGEKWAIERRTLNSFFYQDVLKALVDDMVSSCECELQKWEEACRLGGAVEVSVEEDLNTISNNIIAHTAFSADREKAKEIYRTQRKYVSLLFESLDSGWYWIPGFRYLPTERNRAMTKLRARFDGLLHEVINDRKKAVKKGDSESYGTDLLGMMLAAASDSTDETAPEFNLASVFNNTKLFFFAGQDTVASALTFTLLQLARYPEWQDRARKEVLEVTADSDAFDSDAISRLKVVGMVLNETMRVYPVISSISKMATKDMQIGDLFIPKGLVMEVPLAAFNQDPEIWGEDVHKFNPERFENGVAQACTNPQAFMPFAIGPKSCIGKDFAMMEAKIVIAMVLRRFQLSISPNYKHHPCHSLLTKPKYGLQLIMSRRS
ncbi:hypothetical protein M758_8G047300 [Ceratodon purpureus]|nr:hypothetical protein M758_8G047300 [Ceratodon purpureus]KAG0607684.1 hypothetical protein M758_8G047300 [Ceratodon purpureus]